MIHRNKLDSDHKDKELEQAIKELIAIFRNNDRELYQGLAKMESKVARLEALLEERCR